MDSYEDLPEPAKVEDPEKVTARKINSATRQACRLKKKAKDQEEMATGKKKGGGGGRQGCGWGVGAVRGRARGALPPSIHTLPWPKQYQPPYFDAAKQLGCQQQFPTSATGQCRIASMSMQRCSILPTRHRRSLSDRGCPTWINSVSALCSPVCLNRASRCMTTRIWS